jgi:hypothetical protein
LRERLALEPLKLFCKAWNTMPRECKIVVDSWRQPENSTIFSSFPRKFYQEEFFIYLGSNHLNGCENIKAQSQTYLEKIRVKLKLVNSL